MRCHKLYEPLRPAHERGNYSANGFEVDGLLMQEGGYNKINIYVINNVYNHFRRLIMEKNNVNDPQYSYHGPLASEITPEKLYFSRRRFMQLVLAGAGSLALAACGVSPEQMAALTPTAMPVPQTGAVGGTPGKALPTTDELGGALTPLDTITHYNNYYEFSFDKEPVADLAQNLKISPWSVEISGLVDNPMTLSMDEIMTRFQQEDRIYRHRCVEGWSMVVPWSGFQLSKLLDVVKPKATAKYVRFISFNDPKQEQYANYPGFSWPYTEGLRMDEAMNELTLLATGLYQKPLPKQDGAPIRLVVPWKYGFKSAKALVKIELIDAMPDTFWPNSAPNEYGFYSNVNPAVPHPRWPQDTERRLGELGRRPTLKFNGYEKEVGALYTGMDLKANF
jgi:sulfoxide reductase catalytic subunit YedY